MADACVSEPMEAKLWSLWPTPSFQSRLPWSVAASSALLPLREALMTAFTALPLSQWGKKAFWGHSAGTADLSSRASALKLMNPDRSLPRILTASL